MRNNLFVVALLVALSLVGCYAEFVHYHGHKVIRASLTTQEQVQAVHDMGLDVWSRDGLAVIGHDNDIMVGHATVKTLISMGIQFSVVIDDVESLIQGERDSMTNVSARGLSPFHTAYHTYDEIIAFITNLTSAYPNLCKLVPSIGASIQGRAIPAIEITGGKAPTKKKIILSGGQHAREWVSPATVLYILDQLLSFYGVDSATTTLVDNFSIYIVPLVNPDGYTFTHTSTRLWRKNRRLNSGGSYGVDLNRNWNEHFCEYGASRTQSSDTYCGTAAFSEPETKALSDYITQNAPASAYIDFHSYGQLALRPYGWTTSPPPTEALLKSVGDGIVATIRANGGKTYTSEHGADLYPASGAADDWGYVVAKIPLVYTLELRDTGTYGFTLPANQIVPTGVESFAALVYLSTRA